MPGIAPDLEGLKKDLKAMADSPECKAGDIAAVVEIMAEAIHKHALSGIMTVDTSKTSCTAPGSPLSGEATASYSEAAE